MASNVERLKEARTEAMLIVALGDDAAVQLFYRESMRRNLSRMVRHLDYLVLRGGEDRKLGLKALKCLGFDDRG